MTRKPQQNVQTFFRRFTEFEKTVDKHRLKINITPNPMGS